VPTHYAPRTGLKLALGAGVVGVALIIGFALVFHSHAAQDRNLIQAANQAASALPVVDVIAIRHAPTTQPLVINGETRGWYESTIYARVNGYIKQWYKDIGDKVTAGEVLASIETPELDAQLEAAKAKFNAAQAQVKVQEADYAFAKSTFERWSTAGVGAVSVFETEQKKAESDSSLAKLNASIAQAKLCQADVNGLEALTNFKQVVAPYDGVITARRIDIGDLVTAGSTASTTPLYGIAQSQKIRIFVDIPQVVSAQMKPGLSAVATAKEFSEQQFTGTIARTSESLDPVARTLHVEVDVENPHLELVPGMYVEVSFELTNPCLMQIPAAALLFRATGQQVAVVDDSGIVHFREVHIAVDQGDFVDIESCQDKRAGRPTVNEGEKVALNLSSQIHDGDTVQVNDLDPDKPRASEPPKSPAVMNSATQLHQEPHP